MSKTDTYLGVCWHHQPLFRQSLEVSAGGRRARGVTHAGVDDGIGIGWLVDLGIQMRCAYRTRSAHRHTQRAHAHALFDDGGTREDTHIHSSTPTHTYTHTHACMLACRSRSIDPTRLVVPVQPVGVHVHNRVLSERVAVLDGELAGLCEESELMRQASLCVFVEEGIDVRMSLCVCE